MKSDCGKSLKITQMSKPVELFPDFDFRDEEWNCWGYDCWPVVFNDNMVVFDDNMITAFFVEISVNFSLFFKCKHLS